MLHRENPSRSEPVVVLGAALVLLLAASAAFVLDASPAETETVRALARPSDVVAAPRAERLARAPAPPTSPAARALHDGSAVGPPVRVEPPTLAAQTLEQAEGKLVAKAEGKIAQTEARIGKLEALLASKQADLAQKQLDLVDAQLTLDLVAGFLETAQDELADALAMPEGTEEEIAAKAAAVAHAQLGVKLAQKEVALYAKQAAAIVKSIAKLEAQIEATEGKIADAEDLLATQEDDLALLMAPFDFRVEVDAPFALRVADASDDPLPGARVLVVDELSSKAVKAPELKGSGAVHWQGLTGPDGRCATTLRLLPGQDAFDVIVDLDGYSGPYTVEAHRERAGSFAPSARVALSRDALADATLQLEASP